MDQFCHLCFNFPLYTTPKTKAKGQNASLVEMEGPVRKAYERGLPEAGKFGAGASTGGPKTEHTWEKPGGPQKKLEPGVGGILWTPHGSVSCFLFCVCSALEEA